MLNSLFSLNRSFIMVTALLIWVPFIGLHDFAIAQETPDDSEMEETLSGFDEDESAKDEKDILSGFDEDNNIKHSDKTKETTGNEDWNTFSGFTGISLSYSFVKEPPEDKSNSDWSGLTKTRPFFSLTWDAKLGSKWESRISAKIFYDFAVSF